MKTKFKLVLSTDGGINVSKDILAPEGMHFKELNDAFIKAVREIEALLENAPKKTEDKPVVEKATKEKKTKNAEDNS